MSIQKTENKNLYVNENVKIELELTPFTKSLIGALRSEYNNDFFKRSKKYPDSLLDEECKKNVSLNVKKNKEILGVKKTKSTKKTGNLSLNLLIGNKIIVEGNSIVFKTKSLTYKFTSKVQKLKNGTYAKASVAQLNGIPYLFVDAESKLNRVITRKNLKKTKNKELNKMLDSFLSFKKIDSLGKDKSKEIINKKILPKSLVLQNIHIKNEKRRFKNYHVKLLTLLDTLSKNFDNTSLPKIFTELLPESGYRSESQVSINAMNIDLSLKTKIFDEYITNDSFKNNILNEILAYDC